MKDYYFYIDSAKLIMDADNFQKINIPKIVTEINSETGEIITENIKKEGINIFIRGRKNVYFRVSRYTKILNGKHYDKIAILASAKVNPKDYLLGIDRYTMMYLLYELKDRRYLWFDDKEIDKIIDNIRVRDVDITYNYIYDERQLPKIKNIWKKIKNNANDPKSITIGKSMIQFGSRKTSKYFLKIYDKKKEFFAKQKKFEGAKINDELHEILFGLNTKSLMRTELTLKSAKDVQEKLKIDDNKFISVIEKLKDEKLIKSIIREYFDYYYKGIKKMIKKSNELTLTPLEKIILALYSEIKYYEKITNNKENYASFIERQIEFISPKNRVEKKRIKDKLLKIIEYYDKSDNIDKDLIFERIKEDKELAEIINKMFGYL